MGVCLVEIPDGSGGITMCGSCIERFDPRSIFSKLASNFEQIRLQMDTRILCVRGFLDLHEKTLMMTPGSDTTGINLEEIYEARDIRYSD